jgi:hypothetical protein
MARRRRESHAAALTLPAWRAGACGMKASSKSVLVTCQQKWRGREGESVNRKSRKEGRITVDQHQVECRDTYSYSRATSTEKETRETKQRQEKKTPGRKVWERRGTGQGQGRAMKGALTSRMPSFVLRYLLVHFAGLPAASPPLWTGRLYAGAALGSGLEAVACRKASRMLTPGGPADGGVCCSRAADGENGEGPGVDMKCCPPCWTLGWCADGLQEAAEAVDVR